MTNARMLAHHCHAEGCRVPTRPEMLMCSRHWRMVPYRLRKAVWATYRDGQCDDMRPSADYCRAAGAAVNAVAALEGRPLLTTYFGTPLPPPVPPAPVPGAPPGSAYDPHDPEPGGTAA